MLAAVLLLGVVGILAVVWLVGSEHGRQRVAQEVRKALTQNSELLLGPFEVKMSLWRDFPHVTASIHHVTMTDTAHRQQVPVLRVGRADLRLALLPLWKGKVQVTRLVVNDVEFQERVDSLGRTWGLRGKRAKGAGTTPALNLQLDELWVNNFRMSSHNDYSRRAFSTRIDKARMSARLRGGVLRVAGTLHGELSYLRTRTRTLFERKPVHASVNYKYTFQTRRGQIWNTRGTLNGDTIRIHGTHTLDPQHPEGTAMDLHFVGSQPLVEVLRVALPPRLEPYLEGATSPSKARIHYAITGLSGPSVSPHSVFTFGLRGARLQWPDSSRRISRWDLQGTYDNGPAHSVKSTVLTLTRCRLYSPAGRLDVALTMRDFTRPYVQAHFQGRTELVELAAVVSPGRWRARQGTADVNVRVQGLLPPRGTRYDPSLLQQAMSVRGSVTLRGASFVLPVRGADISGLAVQVGLQDSFWRLNNASGVLNGMRFRATATTVHLLDYLTGLHATASIRGSFAVEELRVSRLRHLLQPMPRTVGAGFSPTSLPKPGKAPRNKAKLAATLGSELIPPGLMLNVALRCQRLVLATDTLSNLAVTVRHDGQRVQLQRMAGGVWGGELRGNVEWPTNPDNQVAPVHYQLGVHFARLDYRQFMARLTRPPSREQQAARVAKLKTSGPAANPALRDLLLAANGRLNIDIDHVQLPEEGSLSKVSLRLQKAGPVVNMPYLRFQTSQGGRGEATATALVENMQLVTADADVTLRYSTLDVQNLLTMVASLTTPADTVPTARTVARATRRASRRAQRLEAVENPSLLANAALSAVLRVEADKVSYGPITGSRFRLVSYLRDGEARLENCSLDALQGHITLSGRIQSTSNRFHHPTQAKLHLENVQLPDLFNTTSAMGLKMLSGDNVRGTVRGVADIRTDLNQAFLPSLKQTTGFLKADFQDLELLNVEALMEALKFMKAERTSHLYFEPVSSHFILADGQLLLPGLRLNSNLSSLAVSGSYGFDGRTNLFVGLKPLQALFGNNDKRVERIQDNDPRRNADRKLTYINLRRSTAGEKYKVRLFQKDEQRREQQALRDYCRDVLHTQRLDTTLHVVGRR